MNEFDISIKQVCNIYYNRTLKWQRETFAERQYHGLVYFLEGSIEYYFEGFTVTATPDHILKLPKNLPYSGKRLTENGVAFIVIDFETSEIKELEKLKLPMLYDCTGNSYWKDCFLEILKTWNEKRLQSHISVKYLLYKLLADLISTCNHLDDNKTSQILDYINQNLPNPNLHCSNLCELFYISESQLRRNILKDTGLTPNEYIANQRLERARHLLLYDKQKAIKEVADECGFASPYYFSRCFTQKMHLSPREYRRMNDVRDE